MNQNTAKNLRDLLLKQQQNGKFKFKGENPPRNTSSPFSKPKQLWSVTNNSQTKKVQGTNVSPSVYVKKQPFVKPNTSQISNVQTKKANGQQPQETSKKDSFIQQSQAARSTINSVSASSYQSPTRISDKTLQNLFIQKQLQSHMIALNQPLKVRGDSQEPQEKKQQQDKGINVFYQHMENYINNYYQRPAIQNQKQAASIFKKHIPQRSVILSQTQSKLRKQSQHSRAESMIQAESAPVSPKVSQGVEKKRNKSIYEAQIVEKTLQTVSVPKPELIGKQHFKFMYVIGKGGFGRVWKVEMNKTRKLYAMKEMSKAKVIQKRSVNSVLNERYLLEHLYHPFLVNMSYSFYDRDNLYLVMDLLTGGDLRFHLGKMRRFSENQTKFFVACILLPLTYLHQNGIIHRDLKPENLVLDKDGYMRLTDLGIARINKGNNAGDTSGTPGYMAPEVMCKMDHSIMVDYYALGVITYEMMLGRRPYNGRSRQEIREQILAKQVQVKKEEAPPGWSDNAIDFINRLIQRKPEKRLGAGGTEELFEHPWFNGYPWEELISRSIKAMYVPGDVDDNTDFQNQISEETQLNEEQINENLILLRRPTVQALFEGYTFDRKLQKLQHQQTQKNSQRSVIERGSSSSEQYLS